MEIKLSFDPVFELDYKDEEKKVIKNIFFACFLSLFYRIRFVKSKFDASLIY